jgi:plasmid stabilization system protein ParE
MISPILISKEAEQDIDEAFTWYELQVRGLGEKFILSVEEGFNYIKFNSEAFPMAFRDLRKHVIHKFPFNIYYRINSQDVVEVIRVLHHKRDQKAG